MQVALIPSRIHGVIDYAVGALVIAAPWLFGFADGGRAQWVTVGLGLFAIAYSLLTRYELGLVPVLSMRAHLFLDILFAAAIATAPFLFGFADRVWVPHMVVAAAAIVVTLLSDPVAGRTFGPRS